MPSEISVDNEPQRLHPSSVLFALGAAAKNLVFPIIVVAVFSRGGGYELLYLLGFIPVLVGFLVKYATYRYRFGPDELIVREGVLTRNERHIPYARIQNIDLTRNPVHRMFNVAEVRIETASGGKPEAVIRVLSMDAIHTMRERVFSHDVTRDNPEPGAGGAETPVPAMVDLSFKEVVIFGLISNRGLVVVAAALGLAGQSGVFDRDWEEIARRLLPRLENASFDFLHAKATMIVVLGSGIVVVAIVLMRLLSVLLAIFKLHGFKLTQLGDDLRAEYGLLTRISATIPQHRIQLLSTRQSRLHRWFKRSSIQVETAGGGGGSDGGDDSGSAKETQWIAPVILPDRVPEIVRRVLPGIELAGIEWTPLERRAWARLFRISLISWAFVAIPALAFGRWWGLIVLLLLPFLWLRSRRWIELTGYALLPNAIVFRSGWWGRRMSVVTYDKIQVVERSQNPFDRRHRMASVSVDTAGAGRSGHRVDIPFLDQDVADRLLAQLSDQAVQTAFRW